MGEFALSRHARDGFDVVTVRGDIDETTAPELDVALDECQRRRPVLVDVTGVEYISSAGLHVLLKDREARTALIGVPQTIVRLFDIIGANQRLPIFPDLDIAIQSLTLSQTA